MLTVAAYLLCTVLNVSDGDSVKVQCKGRLGPTAIRLQDVDAPEIAHPAYKIALQPYGPEAGANLRALCTVGMSVHVKRTKIDRYGRSVASVKCNGKDASTEQVRAGYAWVYVSFAPANSPLYKLQANAQAKHVGLWADPAPIAPWLWRKGQGEVQLLPDA